MPYARPTQSRGSLVMTSMDVHLLPIILAALGLLMALTMMVIRQAYAPLVQGLDLWAAGHLIVSAGIVLLAMRFPASHAAVLEFAGSLALVSGLCLFHLALRKFLAAERSRHRITAWVGFSVFLILLAWFAFAAPHAGARQWVVWPTVIVVLLAMAWLLWRKGDNGFDAQLLGWMLMLAAVVLLIRLVVGWSEADAAGAQDIGEFRTQMLAFAALMALVFGLGFLLMATASLRDGLLHVASHDPLTNVLIRKDMLVVCEQELARSRRHGHSMALLMIDVDQFKAINDIHGHQVGDRVLVELVRRIIPLLRRSDRIGRFGGDEFLVLLPETPKENAMLVANRLRHELEITASELPPVTVSIGVTSNLAQESDIKLPLARVDHALYKARNAGPGGVAEA